MSVQKSAVPAHPFVRDPTVPPDHQGRYVCAAPRCHLLGEPGDAHHNVPDVPVDVQSLRAGDED